jgi:hypothetical protein
VRTLPGGPTPGPLAASLTRHRAELEAAGVWRIEGTDARLAARSRTLTQG